MRDLSEIMKEILPPADYQHRNGFSNNNLIDSLSLEEKLKVEDELINRLKGTDDLLIAETLGYMKSRKSLDQLIIELKEAKRPTDRIIIASIIYEIDNENKELIVTALQDFVKITDKYELISIFYYLTKFQDNRINERIRSYHDSKDYLISYNARQIMK